MSSDSIDERETKIRDSLTEGPPLSFVPTADDLRYLIASVREEARKSVLAEVAKAIDEARRWSIHHQFEADAVTGGRGPSVGKVLDRVRFSLGLVAPDDREHDEFGPLPGEHTR